MKQIEHQIFLSLLLRKKFCKRNWMSVCQARKRKLNVLPVSCSLNCFNQCRRWRTTPLQISCQHIVRMWYTIIFRSFRVLVFAYLNVGAKRLSPTHAQVHECGRRAQEKRVSGCSGNGTNVCRRSWRSWCNFPGTNDRCLTRKVTVSRQQLQTYYRSKHFVFHLIVHLTISKKLNILRCNHFETFHGFYDHWLHNDSYV